MAKGLHGRMQCVSIEENKSGMLLVVSGVWGSILGSLLI